MKQKPSLHSTQPANPTDPQYPPETSMPTPAHPNVLFTPKWLAISALVIILALFAILLIKEFNIYPSSKIQGNKVATLTTARITPNKVKEWKTYNNTKYNFSLEYPRDWILNEPQDFKRDEMYIFPRDEGIDLGDLSGGLTVGPNSAFMGIRIREDLPFSESPKGNDTQSDTPLITDWRIEDIAGTKAHYYATNQCVPQCLTYLDIPYKNGAGTISLFISSVAIEKGYQELFTHMYKSFNFINLSNTKDWQTFSNDYYTFKYPRDWQVSEVDYLNSVSITNNNKTAAITISEGQYPYSFPVTSQSIKKNAIKINIDGKDYSGEEIILNEKSVFADIRIDAAKEYHILFGNDYPTDASNGSLEDYNDHKEVILLITSTIKFK
jgi:hypothetical protein